MARRDTLDNNPQVYDLVLVVLIFRLGIGCCLRTAYAPDEYFQCWEPAFRAAFPEVPITLTWEWQEDARIRSYLPLTPLIAAYKAISFLDVNMQRVLLNVLPRLCQSIFMLAGDWSLYCIARDCVNSKFATLALMVHLFSWFSSFCLCRTLNNSVETALLLLGTKFLFDRHKPPFVPFNLLRISSLSISVVVASLSVFVRPTAFLFWAQLFGMLFIQEMKSSKSFFHHVALALFVIQVCILVDSHYYGTFTIAPLNFFLANILHKRAESFGCTSWHFYFTNGLPTVFGLYFPYFVNALCCRNVPEKIFSLARVSFWNIIALALITRHAEHRFLLSSLPFFHLLIAWTLFDRFSENSERKLTSKRATERQTAADWTDVVTQMMFHRGVLILAAALHLCALLYLCFFHQAGTERAMDFVKRDLAKHEFPFHTRKNKPVDVIVAAPCFAFPGYSALHTVDRPVRLVQLPCVPPWEGKDLFNEDPAEAMRALSLLRSQNSDDEYSYFLTFDSLVPFIPTSISSKFEEIARIHHAHFVYDLDDPFPKFNVLIFRRRKATNLIEYRT